MVPSERGRGSSPQPESSSEIKREKHCNLLENFQAAVDAVVQIESVVDSDMGDRRKEALRSNMFDAREKLQERIGDQSDGGSKAFREFIQAGFQGLGGFNRYGVKGDGSIVISGSHSSSGCIKMAKTLGVEVEPFLA